MRSRWMGSVAILCLIAVGCSSDASVDTVRDPIAFCESVNRLQLFPGFSGFKAEQLELAANEYLEAAFVALSNSPDELKPFIGDVAQSAQDYADLVEATGGDPARLPDADTAPIEEAFRASISPVSMWFANNCLEHDLTDGASVARQLFEASSHAPDGIDRDHQTEARLALYAADAEIHGHPLSPETVVRGVPAIRDLIDLEYEMGPTWGSRGRFGGLVVLADSVTWNETRELEDGSVCSFEGNRITVADGLITRHDYGTVTCDS